MVEELIDQKVELTQKGTVRKRKPKQTIYYFTQDTEDAIVEYLNTNSESERNSIYNNRIDYAFHKLAENIIHTFKFYYTEVNTINELKHEVVCILLEKLPKYKQDKGKAYSYFGLVKCALARSRKGMRLIFLKLDVGVGWQHK